MADNFTTVDAASETITGAADEISGVKYPRVKLIHGADGTNDGDVASANPLPVTDSANEALLTTIDADTSAIATDIAALEVLQTTIAGDTTSIDGKITACNTGAIAGTVTANLSATDNEVLDTIDAVLDTIKTDTAALVVDAAASEVLLGTIDADTGAMVTDLAAIEVLLGTIDADTGAIKTAVEVIDNAISGSEMQVDVVAALPAGTNAIGKLAANSGVDIGDVDILSIAAGDNNIGNVDIASAIPAGTNNIGDVDVLSLSSGKTILRAVISGATSGNNTIVAAAGGSLKIKVLSVCLVAAAAVTVRFESGADGTALTGVMSLDAKSGFVLNAPADPNCHWFETAANTLLNMELGGAVQVSGMITYYTEA
jgi:hypothetical protein